MCGWWAWAGSGGVAPLVVVAAIIVVLAAYLALPSSAYMNK